MTEYSALGAELKCDGGRYYIVTHTEEAAKAANAEIKFKALNPYNPLKMIDLWEQIIGRIALERCKKMLVDKKWNEYVGCHREGFVTCKQCQAQGQDIKEKGCIMYDDKAGIIKPG